MCGYTWEDDADHHDDREHVCILNAGHDGEHECHCGESQEEKEQR